MITILRLSSTYFNLSIPETGNGFSRLSLLACFVSRNRIDVRRSTYIALAAEMFTLLHDSRSATRRHLYSHDGFDQSESLCI
jgi:hypothetical protein